MDINKSPTFRLFSRPSFLEGYGSVLDVFGENSCYNYSNSNYEANYHAILSDWQTLGLDFTNAIEEYRNSIENAK